MKLWMEILTLIIALIGAVCGLLSLVSYSLNAKRKLKVEANFGHEISIGTNIKIFYMVITNIGRRPIVISNIGGSYKEKDKEFFIQPRYPQKRLLEAEGYTEYSEKIHSKIFNDLNNIKIFFAIDSLKKRWKISRKNMRKLKKQAIEIKKNLVNHGKNKKRKK